MPSEQHILVIIRVLYSDQIGMLPLEKKRFFDKHSQQFSTSSLQKPDPVRKETVQMSSTSFGEAVIDVSHDELLRQYGSLYYITPRNFKHRKTNHIVVQQQPPQPPPFLTHYICYTYESPPSHFNHSTVCTLLILYFSATATLLGNPILLLSAIDPFGTGGHGDPNRGTLPGETGHQYVTIDFPSLFLLLSFS